MKHFSALIFQSACTDLPLVRSSKGESVNDLFRTEKSQLIRNWVGWLFALVIVLKDYSHVKVKTVVYVSIVLSDRFLSVSTTVQLSTYPSLSNV